MNATLSVMWILFCIFVVWCVAGAVMIAWDAWCLRRDRRQVRRMAVNREDVQ